MTSKKYESETLKNKKSNFIRRLIDLAGKSIVSIMTFATLMGAIQLFFFAKAHNVKYIDLINSGIALTFGAFYSVYVIFLMVLYLAVAYTNSSQNEFLQNTLIKKSKIHIFKKRPLIPQLLFSIMLSIWPLAFWTDVIAYEYSILVIIFIIFILLSIYYCKLTSNKEEDEGKHPWYVYSLKVLPSASLPFISLGVIGISVICAQKLLLDEYLDTQGWVAILILITTLTFINFFSFTPHPSKDKKDTPLAVIVIPVVFFLIFAVPNAMSTYTPNTIIRAMDIGLTSRCYKVSNLNETGIPMKLVKKYGDIIKLNVTANIDDIFYIARFGDKDMKAKYRFVAKDFHLIDCPRSQANMDTHYM